jgi:hypothetical protein
MSNDIQFTTQNFVYSFPPKSVWVLARATGDNEWAILNETRRIQNEFWGKSQQDILVELQKWLDDGWEPVTEVGPSAIKLETKKSYQAKPKFYWIIQVVLACFTLGLSLLLVLLQRDVLTFASSFEVKMKKPK